MARKTRHKYPNKGRILRKRLISQALLLLLAIAGALFYVFIHSPEPEQTIDSALDQLATSIVAEGQQSATAPPAAPAPPAGLAAQAGTTPPAAPSAPAPRAPAPPPRVEPPAPAEPFAGQSLDAAAAALARRYTGKAPKAWDQRLPGITSTLSVQEGPKEVIGRPGSVVALTLDACGGKKGASYDEGIIALLRKHQIPATIFITSSWLKNNPETVQALAADPLFEIAAHGSRHKPCSVNGNSVYGIKGTASVLELVREVEGNVRELTRATGKRPRWFRSGTAYYDDVAVSIIHDLGLGIAGYSIAGDQGATLPADRVAVQVLTARNGDILLLHLNKPQSGTREGLKKALPVLLEQGVRFVRLSEAALSPAAR